MLTLLAVAIGSTKPSEESRAKPESAHSYRLQLDPSTHAKKTAEYQAVLGGITSKAFKPIITLNRLHESSNPLATIRQCRAEIANLDLDLAAVETLLIRDFGGAK